MKKQNVKDMTQGSPMRLIVSFAIPVALGLLFQQFYNLVDSMIVGKILGVQALASVGTTGSVNFMILGLCTGICNGFAIPIAHKFGAKDEEGLRKFVANGIWLSIFFSIVLTAVTVALCGKILEWMKTPSDIIQGAYDYIVVIYMGIPVIFLFNLLASILRAMGDSKAPLIFLVISSILNIILDFVFIVQVGTYVEGAAYATVIAQGVSGILCLIYVWKKYNILQLTKEEWRMDASMMMTLCNMGIAMGIQYSITAIGSVVLQSAVNVLGTVYVASVTAAAKIGLFIVCPFESLGTAMATFGGQNVGAKKWDRLGEGLRAAMLIGAIYSVIAFGLVHFFGSDMALLFVDAKETEIIRNAQFFLNINGAGYFLLALINIYRFLIQGMGFPGFAVLAGVCEMVARILVAKAFVPLWGYTGACLGNVTAWIFADLFLVPAYFIVKRKLMKASEETAS